MIAANRYGSLAENLRGADPIGNVERSIDFVTAGGDVSARSELREGFEENEGGKIAALKSNIGRVDLTQSPGPVAERFLCSSDPVAVIVGPRGSAKSTQMVKKDVYEAQGSRPGGDGLRRYVASWWREKYVNLWQATIPTVWKVLPADLPGPTGKPGWQGSNPHAATQTIRFRDEFGEIEIVNRFRAFGDIADAEDLLGLESTDVYLNQIETLPEKLFTWLIAIVGRDPPRNTLYGADEDDLIYGKIMGDMNAPVPDHWLYRDFYEKPKPGYELYRQPGGLEPGAENIAVIGRGYYLNQVKLNAHRKWWVNINIHNRPGFKLDGDVPYANEDGPLWDDDAMMAKQTIPVERDIPVVVGTDGGLTPARLYTQVVGGQARLLAEVALQRGGMKELAEKALEIESMRLRDCEFVERCDPSMNAGEDRDDAGNVIDLGAGAIAEGSPRQRLEKYLGRKVELARTNNLDERHEAIREKMVVKGGVPQLWVDPSCIVWRRGANGSYRFHTVNGTTDRGAIKKDFTTHIHDGGHYAALEWGGDAARKRRTDRRRAIEAAREKGRHAPRYNPHRRRA